MKGSRRRPKAGTCRSDHRPDGWRQIELAVPRQDQALNELKLIFQFESAIAGQVQIVQRVKARDHRTGWIVVEASANSDGFGQAQSLVPSVGLHHVLDLLGLVFESLQFDVKLPGGHFEVLVVYLERGVFGEQLLVVGGTQRHSRVIETEANRAEEDENSKNRTRVDRPERYPQLVQTGRGIGDDD